MRIGFDIDGVIFDFVGALERWCDKICDNKACSSIGQHPMATRFDVPAIRWTFYEDWGWSSDTFRITCNEATDYGDLFLDGPPLPGSVEAITRLHNLGHKIIFITARDFGRPGESERQTRQWLSLHGIPYDELHFTKDKWTVDVDIHIDDCQHIIEDLWSRGRHAVAWAQPWNEGLASKRFSSWYDFVAHVVEEAKVREEDVAQAFKRGEEWETTKSKQVPSRSIVRGNSAVPVYDRPRITEQDRTDAIPRPPAAPQSILAEAQSLIYGDRQAAYDHPSVDYGRTIAMFNAWRGDSAGAMTIEDAMAFMVCVKLSRERHAHKRDSLVDAAGYIGCWARVIGEDD